MPVPMLLGVETEYALTGLARSGEGVDPPVLAQRFLEAARKRCPHLRDARGSGMFLANGARLYVDAGYHPEFATPECADPWEVLRYVRAGEQLMRELAECVVAGEPDLASATVFRSNVDYGGSGTTWGCHESYLYRCEPAKLPPQLIPHLVSRVIFAGAGGFHPLSPGLEFTLSPRAWLLNRVTSDESTTNRGIFHTKDESLSAAGYHRLHVISGESLCSDTATLLKLGTTALIVAAADAGQRPGDSVQLEAPLEALRTIAADPECRATVLLANGRRSTAIGIQRRYLERIERCRAGGALPDWAPEICRLWRRQLDVLEMTPAAAGRTLDWAIKRTLYAHWGREQIDPDRWAEWTQVMRGLEAARQAGERERRESPLQPLSRLRSAMRRLSPRRARGEPGWRGLSAFLRLRRTLLETDLRFGQLGEGGIFERLEREGHLRQRVLEPGDVRRALESPPLAGRARVRGEWVARLAATPETGPYVCDWMRIWNPPLGRYLDLSDPFAEEARWRDMSEGVATARADPARRQGIEQPAVE